MKKHWKGPPDCQSMTNCTESVGPSPPNGTASAGPLSRGAASAGPSTLPHQETKRKMLTTMTNCRKRKDTDDDKLQKNVVVVALALVAV